MAQKPKGKPSVKPKGKKYLGMGRMPKTVKAGQVIVHNSIKAEPDQLPGKQGFRVWTQEEKTGLVVCQCGWAAHLPIHYKPNLTANK